MFKVKILQLFDSFVLNSVGPYYRRIGKSFLSQGNDMLGSEASDDRLVQCLRQVQTNGHTPQISEALFTAPNSVLVGNVILKQKYQEFKIFYLLFSFKISYFEQYQ